MADARIAYGLAKEHGIDTTGMTPKEVWDALKEKGVKPDSYNGDGSGEGTKLYNAVKAYNQDKEVKSSSQIKNKNDFVNYINYQTGFKLENNSDAMFNQKRNLLYTKIPIEQKNKVLGFLQKNGFDYSQHLHDYYWITIKPKS